jgi:hypothetical protein
MPDANINTGNPLRFELAGVVRFGTVGSGFTMLWIEEGSVSYTPGRRGGIPMQDRGANISTVLEGNERQSRISFRFRPTWRGLTQSSDAILTLFPAVGTTGVKALYTLSIDVPDGPGAATLTRVSFASCYTEESETYEARAGQDSDIISVTVVSQTAYPTITRV